MKPLPITCAITLLLALAGCGNAYQFTFNDNVVYSPYGKNPQRSLLVDADLQGCLNEALSGRDIAPEELTLLACPSAGVASLTGIQNLTALEQLELSDNNISDLGPLSGLKQLRVLSIRNNNIRNITALQALPILRFVSLQGNNNINCRQLDNLEDKLGNTLGRPATCSS